VDCCPVAISVQQYLFGVTGIWACALLASQPASIEGSRARAPEMRTMPLN